MQRIPKFLSPILVGVVVLTAGAVAFAAADNVTTGQFLVAVAKAHHLDATDPAAAAGALRAAGYALPEMRYDSTLTEGTVVSIASALGLKVTTQRPQAPFTSVQVDAFLKSFGQQLGVAPNAQPAGSPPFNPENKGKKKGHTKSRIEPN